MPFQVALAGYGGVVTNHYPPHKLFALLQDQAFEQGPKLSEIPVEGETVFTDAGKKSHKAVSTWQTADGQWHENIIEGQPRDSLQTLELKAVVWTFQTWHHRPVNIVSDSLYVVGVVLRLERAMLREVKNTVLHGLLLHLLQLLNQRTEPYFITHLRSHLMKGGLAIGNDRADALVAAPAWTGPPLDSFGQARQSHSFFHQSAKVLARQFHLSLHDAQGIVKSCPDCERLDLGLGVGVNPKGLQSLELWQMDVTHFSEFGRLKYLHVCIDTFSMAIWATAQSGEKAQHVIKHLYMCFAVLGVPHSIKTDNGPAYVSKRFADFCNLWGIQHTRGIPHNPTGQAMIERAHRTLKDLLLKQKGGEQGTMPAERLHKALYVLNYLRFTGNRVEPPMLIHGKSLISDLTIQEKILVKFKNPQTGQWEGPAEVKFTGRGYVCLLTDSGTRWVPNQWIKPWRQNHNTTATGNA